MSSPSDVATGVQNLAATLFAAITDPGDAVRIFSQLNSFVTSPISGTSSIANAQTIVEQATSDLCRRTAAIYLAQASAYYQPTSQNDAQNVQQMVCNILDAEILIAGDDGLDETFYALTSLRNSVAQDLTTRGSALPPLKTFTTNLPMPALNLAYQYYQDITRTDQLVASANPPHPAFMPTSFIALSS